jgi:integrase
LKLIGAAKDSEDTVLLDLIMLGLYTGARIEELCQLRVVDVVVENNVRALRITKSKILAGTRLVPINPSISDLVDKLVMTSRDNFLIFSKSKNQYDERSTGLSRRVGRLKSS